MTSGRTPRHFAFDKRGSVGVIFGLSLIPIAASVALAVDYSRLSQSRVVLQNIADSASLAAASATPAGTDDIKNRARLALANSSLTGMLAAHSLSNIARDVNVDNNRVKIKLQQTVDTTIGAFMATSLPAIANSTATVAIVNNPPPICLMSLNSAQSQSLYVYGSSKINAPNCAVYSNSSSTSGLSVQGSATATAASFCTASSGYAGTAMTPQPRVGCPPLADPLANKYTLSALRAKGIDIAYNPCDKGGAVRVNSDTIFDAATGMNPGYYRFCNGLTIAGGANVTFKKGVYLINGDFIINSNAIINATEGVTFYFMPFDAFSNIPMGTMQMAGGATMNVVAPSATSGSIFAGMAFVQPEVKTRTASYTAGQVSPVKNVFRGSSSMRIVGMVYMPQAAVELAGDSSMTGVQSINNSSEYFGIIADQVVINGTSTLAVNGGSNALASDMPAMPGDGTVGTKTAAYLVE